MFLTIITILIFVFIITFIVKYAIDINRIRRYHHAQQNLTQTLTQTQQNLTQVYQTLHPAQPYSPPKQNYQEKPPDPIKEEELTTFNIGHVYRTSKRRRVYLLDKTFRYVKNPIRVSGNDSHRKPEHWLYEVSTGKWFYCNKWKGCCQEIHDSQVPEEIRDRAFAYWCMEQDSKKKKRKRK